MKWPWGKPDADTGGLEARRVSEQNLRAAQAQRPEVQRVASSLRDLRERNHFADALAATYRRRMHP